MGTQLWEDAKAFIKENGGKNFFFFTDTTCDYKFYEKKGCQRICASEEDCGYKRPEKASGNVYL